MFEFAISQHRKRPPTKKFIASWFASCVLHAAALLVLIENPSLLRHRAHMWIRVPVFLLSPPPKARNWRTVTFVGPSRMQMPSKETLKKALYDWNKSVVPTAGPSIRIRWNDRVSVSKSTTPKSIPPVRPPLRTEDRKPLPETLDASKAAEDGAANGGPGNESPGTAAGTSSSNEKRRAVSLPPPENTEPRQIPKKVGETAENTSPSEIPKGTAPPQRPAAQQQPQIFKDERSAIHAEGSGLFDTQGFPLGEYARLILERIKGNWSIPSNLRNSQGRSTLVFFIEKDGSVSNLKVVASSGSQSLDLSALHAVLLSKPLPPLPGGFPGEHVGAKFVFFYNEP